MVVPVRRRSDFTVLTRAGRRGAAGPIWVRHAPHPDDANDRTIAAVAYAIGRSAGGAVARNRIRRRLRPIVADLERTGRIQGGLHLIGADASSVERPAADLREGLSQALERAYRP